MIVYYVFAECELLFPLLLYNREISERIIYMHLIAAQIPEPLNSLYRSYSRGKCEGNGNKG